MILLEQGLQYAKDVVSGKEITTKEVVRQCEIFLEDYEVNQFKEEFKYYADENKLEVIDNLLKLLNFATGFVAGQTVLENLAPFQCFLLIGVFLFRFKNNSDKFKNNDITLFISRKNAKTAIVGIIYILLMLTEPNYSEFYSICLTKELSAEIRKSMGQILEASPSLIRHFRISKTFTGSIICKLTHSFYKPRTSEAGKNNSVRPSAVCSDEHGNFQNADNFNAMKGGQKNVINPIIFRTTTAYAITNSIMEEDIDYIRKVFDGVYEDDRQFALLYYAEEEHLWDDTGIYQSNPLRIEENYDIIRENRKKALVKSTEKIEYLTKDMNNFLQGDAENTYLDVKVWKKSSVLNIDLKGKEVVVGGDFAISLDLNAISIMYKEKGKYYLVSKGFLPKETLAERREKIDYYAYEDAEYCELMEGRIANYIRIEEYIRSIETLYNCKIACIVSDPFNALQMMNNLSNDYEVVLLKQTYTSLSPSIKAFRDSVYNGEIVYQKNKLLDFCVSNAVEVRAKVTEDILLAKENKNKQRIDMLMSSIFCYSQLYLVDEHPYNALDELDKQNW
ncbi:terminase TerL endonuclease subunit [Clostridium estertheticum]|uniref:terminase TerL endonuclease subunit n=1 Tax=Clostridium estertheticum TaxID=238834 RepID=UPI001CF5E819|nr:terminase TerL endonuclease subunit [Clostridium estertheticum]MCB2340892.1 terminase large subunit [Clostridium estertheticum]